MAINLWHVMFYFTFLPVLCAAVTCETTNESLSMSTLEQFTALDAFVSLH